MKDQAIVLRGLRQREGYTQKSLAEALGTGIKVIADIEKGHKVASKEFSKKLCQVLNTKMLMSE